VLGNGVEVVRKMGAFRALLSSIGGFQILSILGIQQCDLVSGRGIKRSRWIIRSTSNMEETRLAMEGSSLLKGEAQQFGLQCPQGLIHSTLAQ
jgi:hypothetical protein